MNRTTYRQTLGRAAKIVGDDETLAALLGVSWLEMQKWMTGEEIPPESAFLQAVGLVTQESRIRAARESVETERSRRRERGGPLRVIK